MILVGTSGYNYPEWKGSFYPQDLPAAKMLPFYAGRFPSVEINATFYRMPTPATVAAWAGQVPPSFRFTLKANRRITHDKRLVDVGDAVDVFAAAARALGPQLGALLFQTPPNRVRPRASRRVPGRPARGPARGLRVPPRLVAERRGLRPAACPELRAVRGRHRPALGAGRAHG
ncbi:MAG: DUF72 domain-containing protein [Vicinamibacterales bacterium]